MGLPRVEAGIDMGEGDRDQPLGIQDVGRLHHQPHGQLHRLALAAIQARAIVGVERQAHGFTCSRAMRLSVT